MAKIRTNLPKQDEKPQQHEDPSKVFVHETREVSLPDPPVVPAGKTAFRMVYKTGECQDIIGENRFDCTGKAKKQARTDNMNFLNDDIISFKKLK